MAITETINKTQFVSRFADRGRASSFSVAAREALYDWLWDLSEDTGEDVEFDVVAICCDFTEYSAEELRNEFEGAEEAYQEDGDESDVIRWATDQGAIETENGTVVAHVADLSD